MRRTLVIITAIVLSLPASAFAEDVGTPVVASGPLLTAALQHVIAPAETATVTQASGSAQTNDREPWVFRHLVLVLVGTLVGVGAGGVIAANVQRGEPAIVLGGAVGGAYAGLIASAVHKARRGEPVGRKTRFGIVAGAIGAGAASLLLVKGLGGV
jgi:hypothetical protein